jgi:uncharacterized membrane protein
VRDYFFPPLILPLFILLILFPFLVLLFIFAGSSVFKIVFGVNYDDALLIFGFIILGSFINIPIFEKEGKEVVEKYNFFGFIYAVRRKRRIVLAVNLGGCIFPSILAIKAFFDLLRVISFSEWLFAFLISSLIIYYYAKPVPGVGIAVPMFIPPLIAMLSSLTILILTGRELILLPKLAFSVGVMSALFGADILHLKDIEQIGSGVVSIGGAGTFDGIFLTGMFAVIFSLFLV